MMGSTLCFERSHVLVHLLSLKMMLDDKGSEAASAACPHPWVPAAVLSACCRALVSASRRARGKSTKLS